MIEIIQSPNDKKTKGYIKIPDNKICYRGFLCNQLFKKVNYNTERNNLQRKTYNVKRKTYNLQCKTYNVQLYNTFTLHFPAVCKSVFITFKKD